MDFSEEKIREEIYEVYERILLLAYLNGANMEELLQEVVSEIKEFQKSKDKMIGQMFYMQDCCIS